MENQFYTMLSDASSPSVVYQEEILRTQKNVALLREQLTREQKKLLLAIIDDKDLMIEKATQDNFLNGFRMATKMIISSLCITGAEI